MIPRRKIYLNTFKALPVIANRYGQTPFEFALNSLEEKKPEVKRFVLRNGNIPSNNIIELAAQAALTHENKIAGLVLNDGMNYQDAENEVFEVEALENFANNVENFAPALLALVGAVGKAGIVGINNAREKNGQKPILSGPFWQQFKKKTSGVEIGTDGDRLLIGIDGKPGTGGLGNSATAQAIAAMQDELEAQAKRDYLRKNAPLFIAVMIVIVCAIWYFTKHKK